MKPFAKFLWAVATLSIIFSSSAFGLTLGTLNLEYFNISGPQRYTNQDLQYLAHKIRESKVDVLAMQEIEGNATMSYFVTKFLPEYQWIGNDSVSKQDLYFLYKPETVELKSGPIPFFTHSSFYFQGSYHRLFDRPPLLALFRDKESQTVFSVVNVHLKSLSTRGKDKTEAQLYNQAKQHSQMSYLNLLSEELYGPFFVMGDYNQPHPLPLRFPLYSLPSDHWSYDKYRNNLDYIGIGGLNLQGQLQVKEIETAIPRRSFHHQQHPDHDLIFINLRFQQP